MGVVPGLGCAPLPVVPDTVVRPAEIGLVPAPFYVPYPVTAAVIMPVERKGPRGSRSPSTGTVESTDGDMVPDRPTPLPVRVTADTATAG